MVAILTGPVFVAAVLIFVLGMIGRVAWYIRGLNWRLDRVAYEPFLSFGLKGGIHSAIKWLIPFATTGWRKNPLLALATFVFHLGAVMVLLFLMGHAVILRNTFGFSLPTIPQGMADVLTVLMLAGLVALIARRLICVRARSLSTPQDWFLLLLVLATAVSGFVSAHAGPWAEPVYIAHLIFGNLFLILAPFTKLSHMVLYFMSRIQIGMDFAIKRGGKTRGAWFPW